MADTYVGANAIIRMEAWVAGVFPADNYVDIGWALSFVEASPGTQGWVGGGIPASVDYVTNSGSGVLWSGSFGFDFRGGGQQSVLIASGTTRHYNFADGSPMGITIGGNVGDTGTATGGSGGRSAQFVNPGYTKVAPGTPTKPTATWVSDTQINLAWTQSSAANGQPQNNDLSRSVNGGAWEDNFVVLAASNSASVAAAV